jgi:ElaB/YqjD/DUF883 family membrane-anchored ribosome-binding protein
MFHRSGHRDEDGRSLRDDLDALQGDVARIAQHFGRLMGDAGSDGARAAREQFDDVRDRLESLAQNVGGRGYAMARETVQERPVVAVLGALALGYALATLLRRR